MQLISRLFYYTNNKQRLAYAIPQKKKKKHMLNIKYRFWINLKQKNYYATLQREKNTDMISIFLQDINHIIILLE